VQSSAYLITGASGFVGRHLAARLGQRAIALYNNRPISGGIQFDGGTMRLRDTLLRKGHGFTHAFLLHGITTMDVCARDPVATGQVNVDGMMRMIDDLIEEGITPVYASSDAVFDGTEGGYTEEHPLSPVLVYGSQKAEVETYLRGRQEPWLIARLSKVVGTDAGTHSLFGEWIEAINAGNTIRCAHDQVFSPVAVDDVVGALFSLAETGRTGLFNVCGPRALSRLDLLNIFLDAIRSYHPVKANVIPCSLRDIAFAEARPLNSSLKPTKLYRTLGREFKDMLTICKEMSANLHGGQIDC
jgi:dTDP-4-dehydrorhamnose reductase